MTTVVALARDGMVWMAADSLVSVCDRPLPGSVKKILRLPVGGDGAELLLAIAGDGALSGLARRFLTVGRAPTSDEEDVAAFADEVAHGMSELAREHGILDEGRMDGMLLLGFAGRLWTLVHAQAIPHPDGLAAIGSGGEAALGAMDALLEMNVEPIEAIARAVLVGIRRDVHSGGPLLAEILYPPSATPAGLASEESSGRGSGVVVREASGAGGGGAGGVAADPAPAGAADAGG